MIRVLVVDDQALVRGGFRTILESEDGIEVVGEAANGEEAIAQVASLAPDVVCMDVQMPGMDGLEATRHITANARDAASAVAVLVLTTFNREDYLFAALEAGASGFLLKNSSPEQLIEAVQVVARGDALLSPDVTRRVIEAAAGRVGAEPPAGRVGAEPPAGRVEAEPPAGRVEVEPPAGRVGAEPPAGRVEVEPPAGRVEVEPPAGRVGPQGRIETQSADLDTPQAATRSTNPAATRSTNPAATRSTNALATLTEREREVLELLAEGISNAEIARRMWVGEATVKTHVSKVLMKLGLRDRVHAVVYAYEHGVVRPQG